MYDVELIAGDLGMLEIPGYLYIGAVVNTTFL